MLRQFVKQTIVGAAGALILTCAFAPAAGAQSGPGPLPTAPGADRAVNGGLSEAHASLPGGPGLSPLEPYLVLWLLPLSGIVAVAAGAYTDKRVRQNHRVRSEPRVVTTSASRAARP